MTSTPEGASGSRSGSSRDERVRGRTWTVETAEAGQRLDKFLAAADRAGSRSRAADALARGRVFVDDAEMAGADGARAVATGEVVRLWIESAGIGGARRRAAGPARPGNAVRGRHADRRQQAGRDADRAARRRRAGDRARCRRCVGARSPPAALPLARRARAVRRPPHRSRHLGRGAVRADVAGPRRARQAVRRADAGARLPRAGRRAPASVDGHLARPPLLGRGRHAAAGGAAGRSRRRRRAQRLPRRRGLRLDVAPGSAADDRPAGTDPRAGPAARPSAGRRSPLRRTRAGQPRPDRLRSPGAARVPAGVRAPGGSAAHRGHGAAARRSVGAPRAPAPRGADGSLAPRTAPRRVYPRAPPCASDRASRWPSGWSRPPS